MKAKKYVAYYRVSTKKQGQSGLGIDAQKARVAEFSADKGEVIESFLEVESGRKNKRPQLAKAIEFCRQSGAILIIAKLDRLARSVEFLFSLKSGGVDFVACDYPDLNTLTLSVVAGLAQYEAELISQRTKDALQAKKRQGAKLGSPNNLTREARAKGSDKKRQAAQDNPHNHRAYKIACDLRSQGLSLRKIADRLGSYGLTGANGGKYYAVTVAKLFKLYQGQN